MTTTMTMMITISMPTIAYIISSHGFGHATRSAAVMEAVQAIQPETRFEIFTLTPRWLFADSLRGRFGYHETTTDVGLVQRTSMVEDIDATLAALDSFYPLDDKLIERLATQVQKLGCRLVMCDIAPLGIAVAKRAGLPSVLVENFTWDWIYRGYVSQEPHLTDKIALLGDLFAQADYHVQTTPVCRPQASATLTVSPVSRALRNTVVETRHLLGIPPWAKLVLMTMGGFSARHNLASAVQAGVADQDIYFLIPGQAREERRGNLSLLGQKSQYWHPDLINASDLVIGKAGYSTVTEVYQAGVPFGYLARPQFRESAVLAEFIQREMSGLELSEESLNSGQWLTRLPELLALPRHTPQRGNGAEEIARFVVQL